MSFLDTGVMQQYTRGQPYEHTSRSWELQRTEITRLYAAENLPLKRVVEIMKVDHSFFATERQYKRRISQWGLDKKVKYEEMRAIVRKSQQRKIDQGKDTSFRVRKRPVDPKKISRFMKGHPNLQSFSCSSPTPSVISYSTVARHAAHGTSLASAQDLLDSHSIFPGSGQPLNFRQKISLQEPTISSTVHDTHTASNTITLANPFNSEPHGLESASSKRRAGKENEAKSSICDSALMKEFFDFSAAAKTDFQSSPSYTHDRVQKAQLPYARIVKRSQGEKTVSVVESEEDVLETLDSLIELAGRVEDQGKYEWSRVLLQRAVRLHRQHFGNEHPSPLEALEALSRILRRQGRYAEAHKLLFGALEAFRKTDDERPADTLECMGLLALVMIAQGRNIEAETLARGALGRSISVLGYTDPQVSRSKEKLGIVLSARGQHIAAERLHREVFKERSRNLGKDHQKTLNSMHNLAVAYEGQGKYRMMESIYQTMIAIQNETIGPLHPYTLTSIHCLATALGGQKRYAEAEKKYRDLVNLRKSISDNEHPHTLAGMHNLAGILRHQGMYEEAKGLYNEVLEIEKRTLGHEHPSTLTTQASLSMVLESLGEEVEAEALSGLSLQSREKVLGHEHPSTLISKTQVAKLLEDRGEYQRSIRLYQEVLAARQKALGMQHWLTTSTLQRVSFVAQLIKDDTASIESDEGDEE